MNINFGILPPLAGRAPKGRRGRVERRKMMTERAKVDLQAWLAGTNTAAAQ
jgi:folate-dependent tRNA-U54 methylase TrmFO/GidA